MTGIQEIRYAYIATLLGVVLATITTIYTAIRSFLFSQTFRSRPFTTPGNFTGTHQFGNFTRNFTRTQQFGIIYPYGGFIGMLAVIIAIVGVLWLGFSLNKLHKL